MYNAFGYDEEALYQHYLDYGYKEGRSMSPVFDLKKYRDTYKDLDDAFGDDFDAYVEHYFTYGMKEKRTSGGIFDPIAYADAYPDVKEAFGYDIELLINHFLEYGMKEGRTEGVTIEVTTPQEEVVQVTAPVIGSLNVVLTSNDGSISLAEQTAEAGYKFYYKSASTADSIPTPALDQNFDSLSPDGYNELDASKTISGPNGTPIFVRVIKVETATGKIKATGIASETPEVLGTLSVTLQQGPGEIIIPAQSADTGYAYYYKVVSDSTTLPAVTLNQSKPAEYSALTADTRIEVNDDNDRWVSIIKVQSSTNRIKAVGTDNETRGGLTELTLTLSAGIGSIIIANPSSNPTTAGYQYYFKTANVSITDYPSVNAVFGATEASNAGYTLYSTETAIDATEQQYVRILQTRDGKIKGTKQASAIPSALGTISATLNADGSADTLDLNITTDTQYTYYYACVTDESLNTPPSLNTTYASVSSTYSHSTDGTDTLGALAASTGYKVRVIAVKGGLIRATELLTASTAATPTLGTVSFTLTQGVGMLTIAGLASDTTNKYYYQVSNATIPEPLLNATDISGYVSQEISGDTTIDVEGTKYIRVIKVVGGSIKASSEIHETALGISSNTITPGSVTNDSISFSFTDNSSYTYYYKIETSDSADILLTAPNLNATDATAAYSTATPAGTTISGLIPGTEYKIRIVGIKNGKVKETALSADITTTTTAPTMTLTPSAGALSIKIDNYDAADGYTYYYKSAASEDGLTSPALNISFTAANATTAGYSVYDSAQHTTNPSISASSTCYVKVVKVKGDKVRAVTVSHSDGPFDYVAVSNLTDGIITSTTIPFTFTATDNYTYYYAYQTGAVAPDAPALYASFSNATTPYYTNGAIASGSKTITGLTANTQYSICVIGVNTSNQVVQKGTITATTLEELGTLTVGLTPGLYKLTVARPSDGTNCTKYYYQAAATADALPEPALNSNISSYSSYIAMDSADMEALSANTTTYIRIIGTTDAGIIKASAISYANIQTTEAPTLTLTPGVGTLTITVSNYDAEDGFSYYYQKSASPLTAPAINAAFSTGSYSQYTVPVTSDEAQAQNVLVVKVKDNRVVGSDYESATPNPATALTVSKEDATTESIRFSFTSAESLTYYYAYKTDSSLTTAPAVNSIRDTAVYGNANTVASGGTKEISSLSSNTTYQIRVIGVDGNDKIKATGLLTTSTLEAMQTLSYTATGGAYNIGVSDLSPAYDHYLYKTAETTIAAPDVNTQDTSLSGYNALTVAGSSATIWTTATTHTKLMILGLDSENKVKACLEKSITLSTVDAPAMTLTAGVGTIEIDVTNYDETDGYSYYYKTSATTLNELTLLEEFNSTATGEYDSDDYTSYSSDPTTIDATESQFIRVVKVKDGHVVGSVAASKAPNALTDLTATMTDQTSVTSTTASFKFTDASCTTYYYTYAEGTTLTTAPAVNTARDAATYSSAVTSNTPQEITGLNPNTAYQIRVIGVDANGKIKASGLVSVTTAENLSYSATAEPLSIAITGLSGCTSYLYKTDTTPIAEPVKGTAGVSLSSAGYSSLTVQDISATILSENTEHDYLRIVGLDASGNAEKSLQVAGQNPKAVSAPTPTLVPADGKVKLTISDYTEGAAARYSYYYKTGTVSQEDLTAPSINSDFNTAGYAEYTAEASIPASQTTYILVVKVFDGKVKATAAGNEDGPFTNGVISILPDNITATGQSITFSFTETAGYRYYYNYIQSSTPTTSPAIYSAYTGAIAADFSHEISSGSATISGLDFGTTCAVSVIGVEDAVVKEAATFTKATEAEQLGSLSEVTATSEEGMLALTVPAAANETTVYWYRLGNTAPESPTVNTTPNADTYSANPFSALSTATTYIPFTTSQYVQVVKVVSGNIKSVYTSGEIVPQEIAGLTLTLTSAELAVQIPAPASDDYTYYYKAADTSGALTEITSNTPVANLTGAGYELYNAATTVAATGEKHVRIVRVKNGYTKGQAIDSESPTALGTNVTATISKPYPGAVKIAAVTSDGYAYFYKTFASEGDRSSAIPALGAATTDWSSLASDVTLDATETQYILFAKAKDGKIVAYGTGEETPDDIATLSPSVSDPTASSLTLNVTRDNTYISLGGKYYYICTADDGLEDAPALNSAGPENYTEITLDNTEITSISGGSLLESSTTYDIRVILVFDGKVRGVGETTGTTAAE